MSKKDSKSTDANRYISRIETLDLWVASGGRCAMCNKFLREDEWFEYPLNLSERAHIAGWTDTPGSPRGDSELPLADRGKADNLMLLCKDHHKLIDVKKSDYPEERLLQIKHEHETRIHHLTGMTLDRETTVLRVFGMVRGSMPEMARQQAIQTVIDGAGRYAKFPLAKDRHSIELDLGHTPDPEEEESHWRIGCKKIDALAIRIQEAIHEKEIRHISLFAMARIPLLVYLGYVLDDKVPIDLYQKRRGEDEGWLWPEDTLTCSFEIVKLRDGSARKEVALMLNLSGTIGLDELPSAIQEMNVYEIRPVGQVPNRDLFRSKMTLDAFSQTYRNLLAQLEQTDRKAEEIHLFSACPITANIECGRHLMRHVHPALVVYDRIEKEFQPTITINSR